MAPSPASVLDGERKNGDPVEGAGATAGGRTRGSPLLLAVDAVILRREVDGVVVLLLLPLCLLAWDWGCNGDARRTVDSVSPTPWGSHEEEAGRVF